MAFLTLGLTSFGGPAAHLGYFRKELIEKRKWISDDQYSQLLALCQFLPGPASSQVGFALGLKRAGVLGALVAFLAFTLPSVIALVIFAGMAHQLNGPIAGAVLTGLKLLACAVVADAVLGMAKNLCPDIKRRVIACAALAALLLVDHSTTMISVIVAGAVLGFFLLRPTKDTLTTLDEASPTKPSHQSKAKKSRLISLWLTVIFFGLGLGLWGLSVSYPLAAVASDFYQSGALVFGGGHVVLPLLERATVDTQLISQQAFLTGYGAAQAMPGPLFSFAAYLGALIPGADAPLSATLIVASTTVIAIFLPGFLLLAAILPFWQQACEQQTLRACVAGANACVVGILAAALIDPIITTSITSVANAAIALSALALIRLAKWSVIAVLLWCVATAVALVFL